MNPVLATAVEVQRFFEARGWPFCIIGGIAVQRWGEPRVTVDVEVTLLTRFGGEEQFVDALLGRFQPRRADAREFALLHRVLLLQTIDGVGVDVALGALPFEEAAVARSSLAELLPGLWLRTCSAEDFVVMKAFASRERDWLDLKGVLIRRGKQLDWPLIWRELRPLVELKEAPEILEHLERLRRQLISP